LTILTNGITHKEKWTELGDAVLVSVTAAIVYGHGQPRALGALPIGGYTEVQVAEAFILVCQIFVDFR
jgi:hypothetical protein